MTRSEVQEVILKTKVIAVIRMKDAAKLARVVEAVRKGGIRAIEITMTTPGAVEAIAALSREKEAGSLVGAGTVLDQQTAGRVIDAGAEFVVSPVTDFEVIKICRERAVLVAPGAFTPTEILAAWRAGADIVKVFPATSVGPRYFRDLRGPLPELRLMPTGGVSLENAGDFIRNGACCVAIGTALLDPQAIESGNWDILTRKASDLVNSLR